MHQNRFSLTLGAAMQAFQAMRLGSAILAGVLLAKSGWTTEEIGHYETLLFIGSTLVFLGVNGLLQGAPPVYAQLEEGQKRAFLFHVFLLFAALGAAFALALALGESILTPLLTGRSNTPHFRLFCWYMLLHTPSLPVEIVYLLQRKPYRIAVWGAFSFGLHLVAAAMAVWAGWDLEAVLYALIGLGVLKLIWAAVVAFQYGQASFQVDLWRRYASFSFPLILNTLTGSFILLFDQWLVGWYYGAPDIFALFRYGSREFPLALALSTALGAALVPQIAQAPAAGLEALKTSGRRLFHMVFPISILILFFTQPIFSFVFNRDFAKAAPLFNVYLLLTASRVLLPNAVLIAKGDTQAIFKVGLAELAIKIILGFAMIRIWGLNGVAWSAVAAFFFEKTALIIRLRDKHDVPLGAWLDIRLYLLYTAALFAAFFIQLYFLS